MFRHMPEHVHCTPLTSLAAIGISEMDFSNDSTILTQVKVVEKKESK